MLTGLTTHLGLVRPGCGQHQPLSRSGLSEELGRETWRASWPETLLSSSSKRQGDRPFSPQNLDRLGHISATGLGIGPAEIRL